MRNRPGKGAKLLRAERRRLAELVVEVLDHQIRFAE
jgi:hypothetical protein